MQTLDLEVKFATGGEGRIEGYASVFGGEPDSAGDVIDPGAFKASLAARAPVMLWSHDSSAPIGVWDSVEEDGKGLRVKGRLILDTARGREAYALLKAGAVSGLSIGYRTTAAGRTAKGARLIRRVDLFEISLVTIPAADRARVDSVKGTIMSDETDLETKAEDDTALAERVDATETTLADYGSRLDKIEGSTADTAKGVARIETKLNRPGTARAEVKAEADQTERKAFAGFLRGGIEKLGPDEAKSLTISTDTAGGYLVPDDFRAELIKNLVEVSPVRQAARISRTSRDKVTLPKRTGTMTASWVAEAAAKPATQPAYGQQVIDVHEAGCYVDVSNALLEDSAIDVAAELRVDFAEEFGRLEGDAFITGDGAGKPEGFLDAAAALPETTTATLDADGLIDFIHALKTFYRSRGVWMMNSGTMAEVRKMKDGSGQYLWREALAEGNPATILGRPVIEAADMPDAASGETPIVFGDFAAGYRIIDRVDLSVLRDPYSVQLNGLVRFHARRRVGGATVKAEALRKLTLT